MLKTPVLPISRIGPVRSQVSVVSRTAVRLQPVSSFATIFMHDQHAQTPELFGWLREAQSFGPFILDDLRISSPPRTPEVTGRAADMPNSFRTPRTESYHQATLGALAATIAGGNGYAAAGRPPRRSAPRIRRGLRNPARRTPRGGRAGGHQPLAVARARYPASPSADRERPPVTLAETGCVGRRPEVLPTERACNPNRRLSCNIGGADDPAR